MNKEIKKFNSSQAKEDSEICGLLAKAINGNLNFTESKSWHAHPVWFINGNPIVGYSKLKDGIRLMFWSGAGFEEDELQMGTGKFKDASISYTSANQVDIDSLKRWLKKAEKIQWDYKNVQKRKGKLEKIL
jgi:hypothetical protein